MEGVVCPDCGYHFYLGDADEEMGFCPKCGGSMGGSSLFEDYSGVEEIDEDFLDEYDDDEVADDVGLEDEDLDALDDQVAPDAFDDVEDDFSDDFDGDSESDFDDFEDE
jgi:hypothetical protein